MKAADIYKPATTRDFLRIGDEIVFEGSSYPYKLCQIGNSKVALIGGDGNRWSDEDVTDVVTAYKLTEHEVSSIVGGSDTEFKVHVWYNV